MAKRVLILLILTTAAATDAEILLKNVRSGQASGLAPPKTTLINLNEEMKDIMNIRQENVEEKQELAKEQ